MPWQPEPASQHGDFELAPHRGCSADSQDPLDHERTMDVSSGVEERIGGGMRESSELDSTVPDGGRAAWLTVICCSIVTFWFVRTTYSWGVIQAALVDNHLAAPSTLSFVDSLSVVVIASLALVNAKIYQLVGARRLALGGVTLMSLSQIFAGFTVEHISGLFLTAGVIMGLGVSMCFMCVSSTPSQYFTSRRGTANGLVYAGGGFGGAVLSLVMDSMLGNIGVAWTLRIIGFAMLFTCLPAAWGIRDRVPATRGQFIDCFIALFIAGALATFPLFVPPFFVPLYSSSVGLSNTAGALLVSAFNFSSALGRVLSGVVADRLFGPLKTLFASLVITALSMLIIWPNASSLTPLVMFVIINGMSNCAFFSIMPTVVGALLGSQRLSVAMGMVVTGWSGGYLMGAPIAGYMLGAFGGTDGGFKAFRPPSYGPEVLLSAQPERSVG